LSPTTPSPFSPTSLQSNDLIPFLNDIFGYSTSSPEELLLLFEPLIFSPSDELAERGKDKTAERLREMAMMIRGEMITKERGKDDIGGLEWKRYVDAAGELLEMKKVAHMVSRPCELVVIITVWSYRLP
jgi:hypothetical protein